MEDVVYPDIVYGSLTSLYETLDTYSIVMLEKAILHRSLRNFFKSLAIFDAFHEPIASHPAVVLEHTWTLTAQYRFREARSIAVRGLSSSHAKRLGGDEHDAAIVLRALLAAMDALIEGLLSGCYESLEEIYAWLRNVPMTDFTDVQVWAVNLYYYLPTLLNAPAGSSPFRDIPCTPPTSSSLGISLLRNHLQQAGRLNEALFLLDTEVSLLPNKDAEIEAMESIRSACLEPSSQPLIYIQGAVALKLALLYAQLGDEESYREEMFNAAAALSEPKDSGLHSHLLRTDTWLARLELSRANGEGPGAEAWEAFGDYAAKVGDFRIEAEALSEALETMIRPGSEEEGDIEPENRERLRARLDGLYARLGSSFHRSRWDGVGGNG
ncbi:MAG: hypothetical protein Q9216_002427 [Gyalolechia sp. 2 TL-2023]